MAIEPDEIDRMCLRLPGAVKAYPFETDPNIHVYQVRGKWFAWVHLTRRIVTLKVDPEISLSLQASWDGISPGYHMNKRHWLTVDLNSDVPPSLLCTLLEDAHGLIVNRLPANVRIALLGDPGH